MAILQNIQQLTIKFPHAEKESSDPSRHPPQRDTVPEQSQEGGRTQSAIVSHPAHKPHPGPNLPDMWEALGLLGLLGVELLLLIMEGWNSKKQGLQKGHGARGKIADDARGERAGSGWFYRSHAAHLQVAFSQDACYKRGSKPKESRVLVQGGSRGGGQRGEKA